MTKPKGPNHIDRLRGERPGWHELFWLLLYAEWSVEDIAEGFGMKVAHVRELMDDELLEDHEWLIARERRAA